MFGMPSLVSISPSFALLQNLNVKAWFGSQREDDGLPVTVSRWLSLFQEQRFPLHQVGKAISSWDGPLSLLMKPTPALADYLTDDVLDETAEVMNVERAWLDGNPWHRHPILLLNERHPQDEFAAACADAKRRDDDAEFLVIRERQRTRERGRWDRGLVRREAGCLQIRSRVCELHDGETVLWRNQPVFSVEDFGNPAQYWLTLQAIEIAKQHQLWLFGSEATRARIEQIRQQEAAWREGDGAFNAWDPESLLTDFEHVQKQQVIL